MFRPSIEAGASPRDAPQRVLRRGGTVAALGEAGRAAAELYAAAYARPIVTFDSDAELWRWLARSRTSTAFIMAPATWFSFERCDALVATVLRCELPIGIYPLPTNVRAAARAAARLVALGMRDAPDPATVTAYSDYVPSMSATRIAAADFYGRDEVDGFLRALGMGTGAAIVHTHSNGADFRLGGHVLCVQADDLRPSGPRRGERCLPCQAGGPCLRAGLQPRSFVGAAAFRTPVVIFLSCNVLLPHGALLHHRLGYLEALFRGDTVRAAIASYTANSSPVSRVQEIAELVLRGTPLGEVAASLGRSQARGTGSYVCVGDPETILDAIAPLASSRTREPDTK
jgi:hypothetical protein